MSDEAKSNEIDEVMSSVRKLVSKTERNADNDGGRLLLTPALRVEGNSSNAANGSAPQNNVLQLDASRAVESNGLEDTLAELEAAMTDAPEEWEPEETETFDETSWAVSAIAAQAEQGEEDGVEEDEPVLPAEEEPDPAAELAEFFQQDMPKDKEALREMIVQIMRDELSGETGERITRNVRKLIRREVNQILAMRDL
ncbi:hypothetical protein [Yoonia sp. 2307UL14-13]|uniref:hypothetical protein n=1 Tax=Yoonia sp. 2307UL14-13 TaxID=3126506 RepID=UPI0030A8EAF9